jgi:hypothetical protein
MYLDLKREIMKKVLLVVLAFLFVNVQAGDELTRKFLHLEETGKFEKFSLQFQNRSIAWFIKTSQQTEDIYIAPHANPSKSENQYFDILNTFISIFLENYKMGKISKKNIIILVQSDLDSYPYEFKISVNNLKLLDNRDFGRNDFDLADSRKKGLYPIKYILQKGKFIDLKSSTYLKDVTKRYRKFLTKYEFPGILEGMVEFAYQKNKIK